MYRFDLENDNFCEFFRRILKNRGQSQFNLALVHYRRGHFAACIKQLDQIIAENGSLVDVAYLLKSRIFLIRREELEAKKCLAKVNKSMFKSESLVTTGIIEYQNGKFRNAFEYFRAASDSGDRYGAYGAAVDAVFIGPTFVQNLAT